VDREVDREFAARLTQDQAHARVEAEALRGEIELSLRDFPCVDLRSDVLGGHVVEDLTCLAVDRPP
jgi:hypothetical protein